MRLRPSLTSMAKTAVTLQWLPNTLTFRFICESGALTIQSIQTGTRLPSIPRNHRSPLNLARNFAWFQEVSSHSRVFFWGEGPDNALTYEWRPYLKFLIARGQYLRAVRDTWRHVIHHRRIPLLPSIPRILRVRFDPDFKKPSFPAWLNPDFESRYGLRARWEDQRAKEARLSSLHPVRPDAYESFTGPLWQTLFEAIDPWK